MKALALLVVLAGCHDLPDLGVCGNGVIEADNGEACDGDFAGDGTCTATCEVACQTEAVTGDYVEVGIDPATATPLFCPGSHACGVDNVCRAASGVFVVAGDVQDFDVAYAATGDFDGDRVDDLVGTGARIRVRFGSLESVPFTTEVDQLAPVSDSPPVVFDREPDTITAEKSDLSIAIPTDGLALLSSDTATFEPVLVGAFPIDDPEAINLVVIDPDPIEDHGDVVISVSKQSPGGIVVKRIGFGVDLPEQVLDPCGDADSHRTGITVSRDRRAFIVAVNNPDPGPGASWTICEYRDFALTGNLELRTVTVAGPAPDAVAFANIDTDACEELVTTRKPNGEEKTVVGFVEATGASCTRATATTLLGTIDDTRVDVLATGAILPTSPDRDELVLTNGVYSVTNGGLVRAPTLGPTAGRRWLVAAVTDLDNDGALDVVAGVKDLAAIDIVHGGDVPLRYQLATNVPVVDVVAGDYNGDQLGDAALVEASGFGQRLSIVHGRVGNIEEPPRPNSRFQGHLEIARLTRFTWSSTERGEDNLDDLVVKRIATFGMPPMTERTTGVLIGEASSQLTMPRFPVDPPDTMGSLVAGKLDGVAVSVAGIHVVTDEPPASEITSFDLVTEEFKLQPLPGFAVDTSVPATLLRTSGAPLIAAFGKPTIHAFDSTGTTCASAISGPGSMHPVDLDGDGFDELAVTVTGTQAVPRRVHVFPITNGAPCAFGEELLAETLAPCVDVVRAGATIVTMCTRAGRTELHRVVDGVRDEDAFITLDGIAVQMIVGDYDGDGVPDLAVGVSLGAMTKVQLVRQCPAHDTRGCR